MMKLLEIKKCVYDDTHYFLMKNIKTILSEDTDVSHNITNKVIETIQPIINIAQAMEVTIVSAICRLTDKQTF